MRMEDQKRQRERIELGVHQKVIIAVAVVASIVVTELSIIHVAHILLLVDPLDNVLTAMPRRYLSTGASAPRAGRVLRTGPLQNFQVSSPRRHFTSPLIPRARRVLRT